MRVVGHVRGAGAVTNGPRERGPRTYRSVAFGLRVVVGVGYHARVYRTSGVFKPCLIQLLNMYVIYTEVTFGLSVVVGIGYHARVYWKSGVHLVCKRFGSHGALPCHVAMSRKAITYRYRMASWALAALSVGPCM